MANGKEIQTADSHALSDWEAGKVEDFWAVTSSPLNRTLLFLSMLAAFSRTEFWNLRFGASTGAAGVSDLLSRCSEESDDWLSASVK